jgi:1-acyl-sn-glycerol-3-phosphate acyltransferase
VVPTAISGSQHARNWRRLQFPKVTVQYGDPLRFEQVESPTREQAQAASETIFAEIKELHSNLRSVGRKRTVKAARAARRSVGAHS